MKKVIAVLVIGLTVQLSVFSQTTITVDPKGGVIPKLELALNALGSATNWAFAPYMTIGAKPVLINKVNKRAIGGGVIGIYNFNSFVGVGGGVDYITGLGSSELTVLNANVQAQLPLQPLMFMGYTWTTNFTVTPFLYSSLGTPFSGTSGSLVVTHEGEGINIDAYHFKTWILGGGYAYIQRQNAGVYSGNYHNIFLSLHRAF